jgi:hypothetical protein
MDGQRHASHVVIIFFLCGEIPSLRKNFSQYSDKENGELTRHLQAVEDAYCLHHQMMTDGSQRFVAFSSHGGARKE